MNKLKVSVPRYQQVAADIAAKIADGNYKVGDKIYARSAIASQYGVSSETARRAICVLSDLKIAEAEKGSGVIIKSYENAVKFIRQYQDVQTINELKSALMESVERQKKEMEVFDECLTNLVEKTEHFRSVNPFEPFQVEITSETRYINQSISDLKFWQNTGTTIIAIKRNGDVIMAPGPYAVFMEHDTIYFVSDEAGYDRVLNFLYPEN